MMRTRCSDVRIVISSCFNEFCRLCAHLSASSVAFVMSKASVPSSLLQPVNAKQNACARMKLASFQTSPTSSESTEWPKKKRFCGLRCTLAALPSIQEKAAVGRGLTRLRRMRTTCLSTSRLASASMWRVGRQAARAAPGSEGTSGGLVTITRPPQSLTVRLPPD